MTFNPIGVFFWVGLALVAGYFFGLAAAGLVLIVAALVTAA